MFLLIPRNLIFMEDEKRHSVFAAKEMAKHEAVRDLSRMVAPVICGDPAMGLARITGDIAEMIEAWEIATLTPEDFSVSYIQVETDLCGRLPCRALDSNAASRYPMRERHNLPKLPPPPAPPAPCS